MEALYNSLPESAKARIHVRKRVVRIDVADDGVAVHCADGGVEHGSVVIGADGVHSRTRQVMQSLAAGLPADTEQPSPFTTTYRMLFSNLPPLPGLQTGTNYECAASGVSTQIIMGDKQAVCILWNHFFCVMASYHSGILRSGQQMSAEPARFLQP